MTRVIENGPDYWPRIGRVPVGGSAPLVASKRDRWLAGPVVSGCPNLGALVTFTVAIDRGTSLPGHETRELLTGRAVVHLAPETLLVGLHGGGTHFSFDVVNSDRVDGIDELRRRTGHVPIGVVPRREVTRLERERVKLAGIHTQDLIHVHGRNPNGRSGTLMLQASWLRRVAGSEAEDVSSRDQSPLEQLLAEWLQSPTG